MGEQSHSFPQQQEVETDETVVLTQEALSLPQLISLDAWGSLRPLAAVGSCLISGDNILDCAGWRQRWGTRAQVSAPYY